MPRDAEEHAAGDLVHDAASHREQPARRRAVFGAEARHEHRALADRESHGEREAAREDGDRGSVRRTRQGRPACSSCPGDPDESREPDGQETGQRKQSPCLQRELLSRVEVALGPAG